MTVTYITRDQANALYKKHGRDSYLVEQIKAYNISAHKWSEKRKELQDALTLHKAIENSLVAYTGGCDVCHNGHFPPCNLK